MATPEQELYGKIDATAAEVDKYRQNFFGLGVIAGVLWLFTASLFWQNHRGGALAFMVIAVTLSLFAIIAYVAKEEASRELEKLQDQRKTIKNSA